jgi:hypothetical protein
MLRSAMTTTDARQLDREIDDALASERGPEAPRLGQLLGRTTSGKSVEVPKRLGAPDTNDVLVFRKTKAKFSGWSKTDHMEASRLFDLAAQAAAGAGDRRLESTLSRWSSVHWDVGGRWTSPEIDERLGPLK